MADENAPTHIAFVKKFYTKTRYTWLEVGKGGRTKTAISSACLTAYGTETGSA
jgi:hypothetical protein